MKLKTLSLRTKLQIIVASFSVLVLAIGFLSLTWFANQYFHMKLQSNLEVLAQVLANNSRAAVTFNDDKSARTILEAASGNPQIVFAAILREGKWFARYPAGSSLHSPDFFRSATGVWLQGDQYYAAVPIRNPDENLGTLILQSNLKEWDQVKQNLLTIFLGLFCGLLLITLIASYVLNNHITRPLQELVNWATRVAHTKDFNARAVKQHGDEVGQLVDSLNSMLAELAKRESIVAWNKVLEEEILERKAVEKDLIEMRNNADSANRAKSQFLANMSHELRTPLNAIIGYSEMVYEILQEGDVNAEEVSGDIDKIRGAGRHLLSLINDILDLSKIEAGKMDLNIESIDATLLIKDVVSTIKPLANARKNQLNVRIRNSLGDLHSDIVKVRQILFNLLSNAVKFTENGQVTLDCFRNIEQDSDHLVCVIHDTGIGISQESLPYLFKPFTQADTSTTRRFGGTGLGLAISSSYAQMLGGYITVESEVGVGSTFTISLPQNTDGVMRPPATALPRPLTAEPQTSGLPGAAATRALLIDDDESVHRILGYQLAQHGFAMTSAFSGAEGLRLLTCHRFDVIVLDIVMPDMDGWTVLHQLKTNANSQDIPVVLYTIVTDSDKGFALGAAEYLVKPIGKQRLIDTLKKYARPCRQHNVLLIDDDLSMHELMARYLTALDVNLLTATNARDGLALVQSQSDIELILLDLIMPEMNGFEFIEAFGRLDPAIDVPIVVISARDLSADEREMLARHVDMIITKGSQSRDELIATILHRLDERTTVSARKGGE